MTSTLNQAPTTESPRVRFDYYLQVFGHPSLRRFPKGHALGERWTGTFWTPQCANRDICIHTKDRLITETEARQLFPGCLPEREVTR